MSLPERVLSRDEQVQAIAAWSALPPDQRVPSTLSELASSLGVHADGRFYDLADSSDVWHQRLLHSATNGMGRVSEVLDAMADKASTGNAAAAGVFLDYIRKVITDKSFVDHMRDKPTDLTLALNQTERSVQELLTFARAHATSSVKQLPEEDPPTST